MNESFSIKAEEKEEKKKRKSEIEVDLCIIYLTKKAKENVIKEPKFYRVISRTYFHFRGKDALFVQRKTGRPYLNKLPAQGKATETIALLTQGFSFNKYLYIIFQELGRRLHAAEFIAPGQRMLYVAEKYDDEGQIHLRYWAAAKKQVGIIDKCSASQEIDTQFNVIVDIVIIPQRELQSYHY